MRSTEPYSNIKYSSYIIKKDTLYLQMVDYVILVRFISILRDALKLDRILIHYTCRTHSIVEEDLYSAHGY